MLKRLALLSMLILASGCLQQTPGAIPDIQEDVSGIEQVGETAFLITYTQEYEGREYELQKINYTMDDKQYENYFDPNMRASLDWIKSSTMENATILAWWDYGHMIRGYTKRNVIVDFASRDILGTVSKYAMLSADERKNTDCPECNPDEAIKDVSGAFATDNPHESIETANKYGADYFLVGSKDGTKIYSMLVALGYNTENYMTEDWQLTKKGKNTVLGKMIEEKGLEGFELVYSDNYARIYHKAL